jgi:hypothetical protein
MSFQDSTSLASCSTRPTYSLVDSTYGCLDIIRLYGTGRFLWIESSGHKKVEEAAHHMHMQGELSFVLLEGSILKYMRRAIYKMN